MTYRELARVMIDATRKWLRRNRTSFAIGFGVIGIGYIAGQYVLSKIKEAQERMAGDRIAKENLRRRFQQNQEDCTITVLELLPTVSENIIEALPSEKILEELQQKKAQRLGRGTGTSDVAQSDLSSGTPSAVDEDGKSISSESYVHASQMASSGVSNGESRPARSKAQLWGELKISSITRVFTLLYTICLLSLLTRIQLNLLGRRNYLSSVVALASHPPQDPTISLENRDDDNVERAYGNDFENNRKYLTFSWWLLHKGWRDIMARVEAAVKEVFGPLNPREDISLERLSSLILDVRRKVEGATPEERRVREWLSLILPPRDQEDAVLRDSGMTTPPPLPQQPPTLQDPTSIPSPPTSPRSTSTISSPLRRLLDETSDLIESPMFTHVLTVILDSTFSQLADKKLRSEAYKLPPLTLEPLATERITEVIDDDPAAASVKLPIILAVMVREAHNIGRGVPNEYVQAMESVTELEGFAAVVYSSNFEFEAGVGAVRGSDTAEPRSDDDAVARERSLESPAAVEAEEATRMGKGAGILDKATGVVDEAWRGFESVWGKVTGRGGDAITG